MKILDKLMSGLTSRPVLVVLLRALPIDFILALGELNRVIMRTISISHSIHHRMANRNILHDVRGGERGWSGGQ